MSKELENFWKGEFGDDYTDRNNDLEIVSANISLFAEILQHTVSVKSVLEFGCNRGLNLKALRQLLPLASLAGVEINEKAATLAGAEGDCEIFVSSLDQFSTDTQYDLVFTKGVLIHIAPNELDAVYEKFFRFSSRYVLIAEYFNPSPVEIEYRGHEGRLFKRDFASEILAQYSDLTLLKYGFRYHLDSGFPQDDLTWFLFEKR